VLGGGAQKKGKGKAKAGGASGGPSNKAAAAAGSSGQGSSRPRAPPGRIIGLRTEEEAVQAASALAAEATSGAQQQTEPEAAGGSSSKKDKEKLRKERQRERKLEEAKEALRGAIDLFEDGAGSVGAVEEAMQLAVKHEGRCDQLAALMDVARTLVEQARAAEAERARVAAEEAAAAAAVKAAAAVEAAAERLRVEEQMAALAVRMQSDALMMQQMRAQVGSSVVPPAAPHPDDENECVMCFDAPKDHIIIPCYHVCVCEACANLLTQMENPSCPICRTAIQHTNKVFHS
jgi:hypothetical protein